MNKKTIQNDISHPPLTCAQAFTSTTGLSRWSKDAQYCYSIGCQCLKCEIIETLEIAPQDCKMRYHVLELVRIFGKPD